MATIRVRKKLMLTAGLLALAVWFVPQQAHAGFFEWLDEATTYNEDQKRPLKPDVLPQGPPAPLFYNTKEAQRWNQYHTRNDLVPVRTRDGAGSMVMRPKGTAEAMRHGYVLDQNGNPILGPDGQPITGYDLMQRRAALNEARQNRGRLHIGEPERIPQRQEVNLGVKTRIGAPVQDWREQDGRMHFNPQPGDYDYAQDQRNRRAIYDNMQTHTAPPQRPYRDYDGGKYTSQQGGDFDTHFPDHYIVRDGDTLTEISEKDRIYGDWKMWPLIYDANRSQISHPDLIYPEQRFGIPRDYTIDDAENARSRSLPPYFDDNWVK